MKELPKNIYIIGAGGVTSYLLPPLLKTLSFHSKRIPVISIFDGDKLEERNWERQFFPISTIKRKMNKAVALAMTYKHEYRGGLIAIPQYFHAGVEFDQGGLVFACVDNHAARRAILSTCDRNYCNAIIAANEYTDSQAIWYNCFSHDTNKDPRIRYPEIMTDDIGDPIRPRGCNTGQSLMVAPQLAIANFTAASHALQLFWFYYFVAPEMEESSRPEWPIEHNNNINKLSTMTEKIY